MKGSSSIDHIRRLAIPSNLGKRRVATRRVVSSISSLEIIGVVASSLLLAFLGIVDFHETLKVATPYSIYDARVHDDLSLPTARGDKLATRFINFGALFFFSFSFFVGLPRNTQTGEWCKGWRVERVVRVLVCSQGIPRVIAI